jgi:DNA-binding GntR family transcriptional regulator
MTSDSNLPKKECQVKINKNNTKNQIAYKKLRKMVVSGEFFEPHNWSVRSLAKAFKMSVVPVTEALRRLEQEDIFIVNPQRGISLKRMSLNQLREANVIREGMEIQASRILAKNASKETIDKLMAAAGNIGKLLGDNKFEEATFEDFQLHLQIVQSSQCKLLFEKYEHLLTVCMLYAENADMRFFSKDYKGSTKNHVALIEAIGTGDPDKAERAIREHILSYAS